MASRCAVPQRARYNLDSVALELLPSLPRSVLYRKGSAFRPLRSLKRGRRETRGPAALMQRAEVLSLMCPCCSRSCSTVGDLCNR